MRDKIKYIIVAIISLFVGIIGTIIVLHYFPITGEATEKVVKDVTVTETNTIKSSIEKVYDATVMIESYRGDKLIGTGTGFVYKKENDKGYIMTNHHVIESGNLIKVINIEGQSEEATILGSDEYADIAVLSIDADAVLQVAEIGDSTKLELGDTLFTVGSPLGSEYMGTVTKGILSGKDRTITVNVSNSSFMMEVLQTDAAINPGNSGGPLVNINGEVVGVNSLKLVEDEIEGMGFAIPIEMAMSSAEKFEKGEKISRPLLGVSLVDVDSAYSLYRYGINIDKDVTTGAVIASVEDNTPATTAKLQKGDVIIEINGTQIKSVAHFRFVLYKYSVGDEITVKYNRNGKENTIKIKLTKSID